MAGNLRNNLFRDIDIGLRKVKTGLTRFARNTGGDDNNVRVCGVAVASGIDGDRRAERRSLTNVERFTQSFLLVDVDHHNFRCNAVDCHGVSDRRADASCSDNGNLIHVHSTFL